MKFVHDIVVDTENERETINNNLYVINIELGFNDDILVVGEIKYVKAKG
jgi:hypothetical protein